MALEVEVVTDGNSDKLKRMTRNMYTAREPGRDMCFVLCAAFIGVNR